MKKIHYIDMRFNPTHSTECGRIANTNPNVPGGVMATNAEHNVTCKSCKNIRKSFKELIAFARKLGKMVPVCPVCEGGTLKPNEYRKYCSNCE